MIIRERARNLSSLRRKLLAVGGAAVVFFLLLWAFTYREKPAVAPSEFYCDAENILDVGGGQSVFLGKNDLQYLNGKTRNDEFKYSGKYSSRVDEENPFGIGLETSDLIPGEVLEISVLVHSNAGTGNLVVDANWGLYANATTNYGDRTKGWESLTIEVVIPEGITDPKMKIYAFNPDKPAAWFDDLTIRRLRRARESQYPTYSADSLPIMNIVVDDKGVEKLRKIRAQAMSIGILKQGEDDWVKAELEVKEGKMPAKIRLKGDWTDHLVGDKWSFRIEMKEGYAWNRLITFSVQSPRSRSFLDEWVYHKLLRQEDVLAPRYDFLNVKLNGKSLGVYAWEEHFEKQLPEYSYRREGPIVKFSEVGFWDVLDVQQQNTSEILYRMPVTEAATVEAFKEARTLADSTLSKEFEMARNLMFEYMYSNRDVGDIFDLERLTNYSAMVDICQAHHGFIWHNQRFYYNPITEKLEPIGFDGYTSNGPLKWIQRPFIGYARNLKYQHPSYRENMFQRWFLDKAFVERYVRELLKITDPAYVSSFMASISKDLDLREALIKKEFKDYTYDRNFIEKNAKEIREIMFPFKESSVKVYYEGKNGNNHHYKVFNWHCLPVNLTGLGRLENRADSPLKEEIYLPAFGNQLPPDFVEFDAAAKGNFLFFTIPGMDSVFSVKVLPWSAPMAFTAQQELFDGAKPVSNPLYEVKDKEIHFKPGKHTVDHDVIIPEGYTVRMVAGTDLDFVKQAKFISKSPLYLIGEEELPILIRSSDQSANGFTVLQVWEQSMLRYVQFSDFTTLTYKGWGLTGAVTFYESKVDIEHCKFLNNHCEDGLNLVRCNFDLKSSLISNTPFDGFDSDFSEGRVMDCVFHETGNDGMDFSGSKIYIINCKVENSHDKGLSAGEESTIEVKSLYVDGAVLGIASKDLSQVTVEYVSLKNVDQGFACYRKKPEYGPAKIFVTQYDVSDVRTLHTIELGSFLKLGEQEIQGNK
ncbi:MAG: right-handed parallel beta-helix repeat-containing protein [Bacteroidia bacterium]|nr:right-handed parallel beta-helix repeat-containing protein [Bacteroidia bacterium]